MDNTPDYQSVFPSILTDFEDGLSVSGGKSVSTVKMADLTSANNIKKVFLITGKYCSKVFAWTVSFQDSIQTKGKLRALIQ